MRPVVRVIMVGALVLIAQPSAAQPTDAGTPAVTLATVGSRVEPAETVYVTLASGNQIRGRFVRATATALTVEVRDTQQEFLSGDVRVISRRGAHHARQGMKYGFLGGAVIADIAVLASGSSEDAGARLLISTLAGGAAGLFWGGVMGAVIHERQVVYKAAEPTVRVVPVLSPGRAAVAVAARF